VGEDDRRGVGVIWTFECGDEIIHVETRIDNATNEYLVVCHWAAGQSKTERFQTVQQYEVRMRALEGQLAADNWNLVGSPEILPHGWREPWTG
jgi:hypothetical protein